MKYSAVRSVGHHVLELPAEQTAVEGEERRRLGHADVDPARDAGDVSVSLGHGRTVVGVRLTGRPCTRRRSSTAFATVFVAELPDKTMLATVVLSARFKRPLAVWIGSAIGAHRADGHRRRRRTAARPAPRPRRQRGRRRAVRRRRRGAVAVRRRGRRGGCRGGGRGACAAAAVHRADRTPWWRISATVFGVVFLAEWGDLTQLAAASLASRGDALSVFIGATAAMITVAAIGVVAGRALLRVLPEHTLRKVAAGIFAVLRSSPSSPSSAADPDSAAQGYVRAWPIPALEGTAIADSVRRPDRQHAARAAEADQRGRAASPACWR